MKESYFITELPRTKGVNNKINWSAIKVNSVIRVCHLGVEYDIIILDKFKTKRGTRFVISLLKEDGDYQEWDKMEIYATNFQRLKLGNLVSTKLHDWLEKSETSIVFDFERNLKEFGITYNMYRKITHSVRREYYFKCEKCNLSFPRAVYHVTGSPSRPKGTGCPICDASGARCVEKGINDIATTHPHLIQYFVDIEDAYRYSKGTNKYIDFKCPDCGTVKNMLITNFIKYGLCCPSCADSIPYGEKFVFNLLKQAGLSFKKEYSPSWIAPYRYDFFIPSLNLIIETDGGQHKEQRNGWRGVDKEKEIDEMKEKLANENGLKIIRIDTKRGVGDYIKKEIMKSEIPNIIDLSNVDFVKCGVNATRSHVFKVAVLTKEGRTIKEISEELCISESTVKRWKKQALFNKWI